MMEKMKKTRLTGISLNVFYSLAITFLGLDFAFDGNIDEMLQGEDVDLFDEVS